MLGVLLLLGGLLTALGCAFSETETATVIPPASPDAAIVSIGDAIYSVDLAVTPSERQQGLSGREVMDLDTGMLFVFEEGRQLHFWMLDMHFPLDIIWIDDQCRLLEVAADVPAPPPGAGSEEIARVRSPSPARYVLEVNAGEAARNGLQPGDPVAFRGAIAGQYGC